jgi:uncharacterized ion transporter superfamily protein YfcC
MALIRLFGLLFVVCTISYLLVSVYSRSVRTEKLEKRWDADRPEGIDRDTYVREGLRAYDTSFRRRLILLIYVVPFVAVAVTVYVTNYM